MLIPETYLWKTINELVCKCLVASLFYQIFLRLYVGNLPLRPDQAEFHILVNGVVEEKWLLLDKTDLRPPPLKVDFSERSASHCNQAVPEIQAL